MKKERNNKHCNYEEFSDDDTRYYGLWLSEKGNERKVKIDPKRFQKATGREFTEAQKHVINKRHSRYFRPAKNDYSDYCCTLFVDELSEIKADWENNFKKDIESTIEQIPKPQKLCPGDYSNLQSGISGYNSAVAWANYKNQENNEKYKKEFVQRVCSRYSAFVQFMASKIEAITVRVLDAKGMIEDHFDRIVLYGGINNDTPVRQLAHFSSHDKLYCIWNFVKHNSLSTYKTLKERYPDAVIKTEFEQGSNALYYVDFSEELILELIDGCTEFFREYCLLMFGEDYNQAHWNHNEYFLKIVNDEIELVKNPLGLDLWDDIN